MKPTFIAESIFASPYSDESDCFTKLIGEPEFHHGHDWVTNPIIEELAASLKHDTHTGTSDEL